jgi:hypothetical protein
MWIIKLLLNLAIIIILVRFISLFLARLGIFNFMERLFGKRSNNNPYNDYQENFYDDED